MATAKTSAISRIDGARKLDENATMRIPLSASTTVVRVEHGTVLVTREGDLDDHVLEPGDELRLDGHGLAVAWAFTEAVISVRPATSRGAAVRTSSPLDDGLTPSPRAA